LTDVLAAAGLLQSDRVGRRKLYRVQLERLELLREWLGWFEAPKT
jgi:hypothetical protein